jgi:hypothetical protein
MKKLKGNLRVKKLQRNWGNILMALSESPQLIEQAINILSYTM